MAGSPSASTPLSAPSPSIAPAPPVTVRPSICMKPMPTPGSSAPNAGSPTGSLTSKEWIVPPRPKPGRKPATDTPPTKRKAQNRAAQRAFRERRAARVGELEEQIKLIEEEHDEEQAALKSVIARLEEEIERYQEQVAHWAERCRQLERQREDSRPSTVRESVATVHTTRDEDSTSGQTLGCGNCTVESHCQCVDDVVNGMADTISQHHQSSSDKQPAARRSTTSNKRIKSEPADAMEIDFTTMYSKPRQDRTGEVVVSPSSAVADPCGFCQDGTPCICAEMAEEQQNRALNTLPSTRQMAQFTPPPSEGDVVNPTLAPANKCASGPGTCAQCQADPNSTLFCKSLAASRAQTSTSGGCCGGKGPDGGCCQGSVPLPSRSTRSKAGKTQLPPLQESRAGVRLSCADAYTTLSRHPGYERASSEIASWMPKLHANPAGVEGRPALEIDAANVMSVLRDFDRRFGSDR